VRKKRKKIDVTPSGLFGWRAFFMAKEVNRFCRLPVEMLYAAEKQRRVVCQLSQGRPTPYRPLQYAHNREKLALKQKQPHLTNKEIPRNLLGLQG
jgi:hypothetical protein